MRRRAAGVGVILVVVLPWLGACTAQSPTGSPPAASAAPTAEPTPLAAYDTSDVAVARAPFCDRVSPTGIEHALGGAPEQHAAWEDGDAAPVGDIGQEYGCSWNLQGTVARTWVFAPPVTARQAGGYSREEVGPTCRRLVGAPEFGTPGVAVRCGLGNGDVLVRFAGLFGDAWTTCELQTRSAAAGDDQALVDRAGTWCVTALVAARS